MAVREDLAAEVDLGEGDLIEDMTVDIPLEEDIVEDIGVDLGAMRHTERLKARQMVMGITVSQMIRTSQSVRMVTGSDSDSHVSLQNRDIGIEKAEKNGARHEL